MRATGGASVVLCTADVGCGHARAASAIATALRHADRTVGAPIIDVLADAPRWFTAAYRDAYLIATRRAPRLTGWLYDRTDERPTPSEPGVLASVEDRALRHLQTREEVLGAEVVLCTHFLCARVLARLRERQSLSFRLAVVITDQHPHAAWRVPGIDLFLVAGPAAVNRLEECGFPARTIHVSGIPIDQRFSNLPEREVARRRHGLPPDSPVALVSGGGLGLGGIDRAAHALLESSAQAHVVVVCGRNLALLRQMRGANWTKSNRCHVVGKTNRMHELMAAADLLVGKPGGLTTCEALAAKLPMVLFNPIPGQEVRNAEVLVDSGAAVLASNEFDAGELAARLLESEREQLLRMQAQTANLARPDAAKFAAREVLRLLRPPLDEPSSIAPVVRANTITHPALA
ncbi:MAG: hypothetical protein KF691_12710 [Phycisphaeraceae bacterium]|nr:hypothetical protein [Phycisphaeraceae bacterium]